MRIAVTGATGFLGKALVGRLLESGHEVSAFSRTPDRARRLLSAKARILPWKPEDLGELAHSVDGLDAIVNLAGENIGAGRWTESRKQLILNSRVHAGRSLALAFTQITNKPRIFVQASAVGYYGNRGEHGLEESDPPGTGFLADAVRQWEESVGELPGMGIRLATLRFGLILGNDGGALPRMIKPFKLYAGGVPGSGRQWVSWIHLRDAAAALQFCLETSSAAGAFNACAPDARTAREFYITLGKILKRPCWMPLPAWVLEIAVGEMAEELLLWGQKAHSDRLEEAGFRFEFPELGAALKNLLQPHG